MSREIDERIVAMYFDNRNFESGAQQTLKTLEQLKQSCNMEGVGKGFEAIGEVSKKMKLDKITQGISKMKTAFNGVGNIIKKAFSLTPFDNMMHALNNFRNNFLNKIIGFDIAGKLASSIENTLRSLTIAPVSAGWSQYENTMDSVKTIMSSTGETIDVVKAKLGEMTDYANQTIYSLNNMTSNLGKFTNNGVKLDDATNAMIGLANATADAGQGAQQASMAMYNVSQAIGVGKMTTIDWKSLENANIATQKLKKTFIETALASGSLEKKVVKVKDATTGLMKEETQYWTKAEKGSKAEQVTVENFRETLNKGWLDKKAMLDTFAIYSGQLSKQDILNLGYSDEDAERFYNIGQEALKAAQEVRTFSKMMDAARESVQSSWATSFEYIFGDMQEGTNLWKTLNEKIDGVLSSAAENRNNILMSWRGLMKDEDGQVHKIEEVYKRRRQALEYNYEHKLISSDVYLQELEKLENGIGNPELWVDYREIAIGTFMDLFDTIKMVAGQVKGAWEDVFGAFDSNSLKGITSRIRGIVTSIKDWLGSSDDVSSRISKLRKGLSGVFNVLKIGWNVLKTVISAGWNLIKPFLDPILNLFEMFGKAMDLTGANNLSEIIQKLSDKFKSLVKTVKELGWSGVMSKVGNWFSDVWQKMKTSVKGWLTDNGFGGVVDWFRNIRTSIESGIQSVKDWWENPDNKIAGFFKGMYDTVTGWFKSGVDENGNETGSPIAQFFYRISSDVDSAYKAVVKWWNGSGIPKFFENLWNSVTSLFQTEEKHFAMIGGERREWATTKTMPIVQFFVDLKDTLVSTFEDVKGWPVWNAIGNFFSGVWESISGLFQTEETHTAMIGTERREWTTKKTMPIIAFFTDLKDGIINAFETVKGWGVWKEIGDFFSGVWESITSLFQTEEKHYAMIGSERREWTTKKTAPIVQFFLDLKDSIINTFNEVKGWGVWIEIGNFFTSVWESIASLFQTEEKHSAMIGTERREWTTKREMPIVSFFTNLWDDIQSVWAKITGWPGWQEIANFISNTWNWILGKVGAGGPKASSPSYAANMSNISTELVSGVEAFTTTSTGESELQNAEKKVNILTQVIEAISGFIDKVKSAVSTIGAGPVATRFFDSLGKVIESLAIIVEHVVNLVHSIVTNNLTTEQLVEIGAIITAILGFKFLEYKNNKNLAKIGSNSSDLGSALLKIAGAFALIALGVSIIGKLDVATLGKAVGVVVVLGVVLYTLMQAVNKIGQTFNVGFKDMPVTTTERVLKHLITSVTITGTIAETLALLPGLLEKLKDFKGDTNGDAILKTFEGIALTIASLILSIAIFNKLSGGRADVKSTAMSALGIVAGLGILLIGLDAIIGSLFGLEHSIENFDGVMGLKLSGLTIEHIQRIKAGGQILAALGEALGGFLGAIGGGLIGGFSRAKSNQDALAVEDAVNILKDVSIEDMNHMAEVVGVLSDIQAAIPDYEGVWEKWLNKDKLGLLGDSVGRLGIGLGTLVREINPADLDPTHDVERLKGYTQFLSSFGSVLQSLYDSVLLANQFDDSFYGSVGRMSNTVVPLYAEAAKMLAEAVQEGLGEEGMEAISAFQFDATGIVTAICRSLEQNGSKEISAAVRNMINEGLKEYGGVNEFGNPNIHSTEQIDKSLETIFSHMTQNGGSLGFSGVLSSFLGEFTDQTKINELLGGLDFTYLGDTISDKINGSINIDMTKWTETDDQGNLVMMKNLEDQWTEMLSKYDELGGEDLEIQIRPVLNMDGFGTEMFKLRGALSNELPLNMKTTIDIGDQALAIDDANIVAEIRSVRTELQTASAALQRVLWAVDNSLGSKINGVTSAVSRLKLNVSLKQIDDGLGRSASNSALTGVSAPWDMDLAAPHAIP